MFAAGGGRTKKTGEGGKENRRRGGGRSGGGEKREKPAKKAKNPESAPNQHGVGNGEWRQRREFNSSKCTLLHLILYLLPWFRAVLTQLTANEPVFGDILNKFEGEVFRRY